MEVIIPLGFFFFLFIFSPLGLHFPLEKKLSRRLFPLAFKNIGRKLTLV